MLLILYIGSIVTIWTSQAEWTKKQDLQKELEKMKKLLIYVLVLTALVMSACGGATETPAATAPATEPGGVQTAERCGDKSQLADEG
jgi:hypothetical protein